MQKVPDISYVIMHFCSLLPLMNFPYLNSTASSCEAESTTDVSVNSPCSPEVVDKMALMIYRELEKAPIKIVAVYM
jgi:hypothetical protein